MNLLDEPWLPVCDAEGTRRWVTPADLADPTLRVFDADRADFNGALAQFAIGLLQTVTPAENTQEWRGLFRHPPCADTLAGWFAPIREVFDLDGDGARFMQDRVLVAKDKGINDIGFLLIEAPGEQTIKKNRDHFIKRDQIGPLCPGCAATALFTLQINAPSGGSGHRTSLRGGGPLTTIVGCQPARSLWHDLWLNVLDSKVFLEHSGDQARKELHLTFPWQVNITELQKENGELSPIQLHPVHVFWSMSRRIRLDFDDTSAGLCGICMRHSDRLIRRYVTRNHGLNYKGCWDHPLTPHYLKQPVPPQPEEPKKEPPWLPVHPQEGGIGYRHWLGWVLGATTDANRHLRSARVVTHLRNHRGRDIEGQLRLWAFGYDMDNKKARCWYEARLPLYGLAACDPEAQRRVEETVRPWLAGANLAVFFLRAAVKSAWFDDKKGSNDGERRKKMKALKALDAAVNAGFWSRTEPIFYRQLSKVIECARADEDIDASTFATGWLEHLREVALDLFDGQFVGAGAIERQNPRRIAKAYQKFKRELGGKKIREALGLPAPAKVGIA